MDDKEESNVCKVCKVSIGLHPMYDPHCNLCHAKVEKWLEGPLDEGVYKPRYDGAYFDDATISNIPDSDTVLRRA